MGTWNLVPLADITSALGHVAESLTSMPLVLRWLALCVAAGLPVIKFPLGIAGGSL
jgi:hypothetical protein